MNVILNMRISIHKALAGLDVIEEYEESLKKDFNPQGPRGPRPETAVACLHQKNFNPQGPRGPRRSIIWIRYLLKRFQSTRPSRASTKVGKSGAMSPGFQSTRPSRASTIFLKSSFVPDMISIHKALAGLDALADNKAYVENQFQSTRPSRASTVHRGVLTGPG